MMRIFFIMIAIMIEVAAFENYRIEPEHIKNGNYMGIKILDSKVLTLDRVNGLKFCEISDILYDKDKKRLYALSDKGNLFKLTLVIEDKKIKSLEALSGHTLKNTNGKKLFGHFKDSEGLAMMGKSLLVSFERKPRIMLYDEDIQPLKELPLPKSLRNINHYRAKNYALEALTYDDQYGYITAPEYPLRSQKRGYHDLYSADGKMCTVKVNDIKQAITEMEMMPDGNLLLLMRKFTLRSFSFETMLLKVDLLKRKNGICQSDILAWMSTKEGWAIDNFEGLTHVYDNVYIMVSDNNNNPFEKTILTLFEIKEK